MTRLADWQALTVVGRNRRLVRAAGISSAVLVCHPDTWAEIRNLAGAVKPPQVPAAKAGIVQLREDGLAEVTLAGVEIAAVMHAMRKVIRSWTSSDNVPIVRRFPPPSRALATRAYLAFARTVERVSGPEGAVPPIILDDRIPDARP